MLIDHQRCDVPGPHRDRNLLRHGPQVSRDPDAGYVGVTALGPGLSVLAGGRELDADLSGEVSPAVSRARDEEGLRVDAGAVGQLQRGESSLLPVQLGDLSTQDFDAELLEVGGPFARECIFSI